MTFFSWITIFRTNQWSLGIRVINLDLADPDESVSAILDKEMQNNCHYFLADFFYVPSGVSVSRFLCDLLNVEYYCR